MGDPLNTTISIAVDDIPTRRIEGQPYPPEEQFAAEQTLAELDAMIDSVEVALARGEMGEAEEGLDLVLHLMDDLGIRPEFIEDLKQNHPDILSIHNRVLIKAANALRRVGDTKHAMAMLASSVVVRRDGHTIAFDYPFEEGFNNPSGGDFSRDCAYVRPEDSWAKNAYDKLHAQLRGEHKCYSKLIDPAKRLFPNGAGRGTAVCPSIWENFYPVSAETRQGSELAMGQRTDANVVRIKMSGADGFDRGVVEMYCGGVFHSRYGLMREGEELKSVPVPLCAGAVSVFQLATNVDGECRQGLGVFHLDREPLGEDELQVTLTWTSEGGELEDLDLRLVRMSPDRSLDEGICVGDGMKKSVSGIIDDKGMAWPWTVDYPHRYEMETCYHTNCRVDKPDERRPHWGRLGDALDDPLFDIDCQKSADGCVTPLDGGYLWGPENIRLSSPERDAVYMVHLSLFHRMHAADARIAVSVGGKRLADVNLHVDKFYENKHIDWPIVGYLIYTGEGWSFERDVAPDFPGHVLRTVCDEAGEKDFPERWSRLREAVGVARNEWNGESARDLVEALAEVGGDLPPACMIDKESCMASDVKAAIALFVEHGAWDEMETVLDSARTAWRDSGRKTLVEAVDEYAKAVELPPDIVQRAEGVRAEMERSAGSLEVLMRRRGWDDVRRALYRIENDESREHRQEFADAIRRHGLIEKLPAEILNEAFPQSYKIRTRLDLFDLLMEQGAWESVEEILRSAKEGGGGRSLAKIVLEYGRKEALPLSILKSAAIVANAVASERSDRGELLDLLLQRGAWDEVLEVMVYSKEHLPPWICAEIAEIVLEYYDREGMTGEILGVASTLALKAEIQTAYFELLLRRKEWTTVKDILEYHVKCNSHPITNLSRAMLNVDNEGELPPELLKLACEKGTNLNTIIDIFSLLVERKAWREVEDVMKSESSHWCKAMKGVIEKKDSVPLQISGFEC